MEFYQKGDTLPLYSGAGENPRIIVYASAKVGDINAGEGAKPEATAPQTKDNKSKKKKGKPKE